MTARRFAIVTIVLVCLGGPLVETVDQWDHTAQDGNDTEANSIIVALCVGLGLTMAGAVIARIRALARASERVPAVPSRRIRLDRLSLILSANPGNGPPVPLRV